MRLIRPYILSSLFLIFICIACQPQETIRIVITPTPGPTDIPTETPIATDTDEPVSPSDTPPLQPVDTEIPSDTPSPDASDTDEPTLTPSSTPTETPDVSPTPIPTFMGSILNEDYRLPTLPPGREVTPVPSNIPTLESQPDSTVILPDLDPEQMGIQINADRQPEEWVFALDRASQLGLRWVKVQVNWQRYQYEGPEQTWGPEFQQLEDFLRIAEDRGLMVMVSIAKAPRWARSTQVEDGPPDDPQHLANFISIFFSHRGGQTVDAVEIWNEPNLLREWQGQPLNGTSYMRYFDAGYQAVKAYSPSMPVVTAGLAPTGDNPGVSRNDRDYLQEMYDAGLGNYQDVFIGIHPYGWGNPPDSTCCPANSDRGWNDDPHFFFLDNINDMREIMVRNGHENRQMWITELGWATWEGLWGEPPQLWMDYNSVWDQAEYIIRSFEIAQQRPDIGLMFLWNLNYGSPELVESRSEQAAYTIMPENGGRLRPAFWMIYDAVRPDEVLDRYDRDG